jgi:Type I site-specific restriction-modification system, R (restriction) subunit and related helicases
VKITTSLQNNKAVPSQLERVTNQWQPALTGGTARERVTDEYTIVKDRTGRRYFPAQDLSQDPPARSVAGAARIQSGCSRFGNSGDGWRTCPQGRKADPMNTNGQRSESLFGDPISVYTRRQAIEDGVLVDLMQSETVALVREAGFRFPVAMTTIAFCATVGEIDKPLPAGQDLQGRLWDVLWMLKLAIKSAEPGNDRVKFSVVVWDGKRRNKVSLWSLCGPGDNGEPVITIMLEGED